MSRLAYLAYPIDAMITDEQHKHDARMAILNAGYVRYEPGEAFGMTPASRPTGPTAAAINSINETALLAADLLVALWPREAVSVGVPAEIALAVDWGMPTLIVVPGDDTWPGVVMSGWGEYLKQHRQGGFTDLAGLYAEIRLLDARPSE